MRLNDALTYTALVFTGAFLFDLYFGEGLYIVRNQSYMDEKLVIEKEILIRGRIMQLSASVEATLAKIILFCQAEDPKDEAIKLKNLTLGLKMDKANKMLEHYYPAYHALYKKDFENLTEFKTFRNRIAHCFITWKDENSLTVWDISEDVEKIQFYEAFEYTTTEIMQNIEGSKKLLIPIIKLSMELEEEFLHKYPGFFDLK